MFVMVSSISALVKKLLLIYLEVTSLTEDEPLFDANLISTPQSKRKRTCRASSAERADIAPDLEMKHSPSAKRQRPSELQAETFKLYHVPISNSLPLLTPGGINPNLELSRSLVLAGSTMEVKGDHPHPRSTSKKMVLKRAPGMS